MLIRTPEQDIERILYTEKAIAARVEQIGTELTERFGKERPVLVCVLKGASFFFIDLCRCMNCPIDMDFISVSSYGAGAQSSGVVKLIKDLDHNITGRHVIIVEDIIDSGLTMKYLRQLFGARNPASVTTVSFLDKATCHAPELKTDYCGFEVEDEFVVGYGLDFANYYRNLPYIGILKPECYEK
ncbi:MAG: hypoxanthine phosphoribosyltransferase [Oscillospiraceae bacterium]|nr:hypoxanthine phosphoribosyltransferase [Oscillospiraceae bacterium]MBQ5749194.1 hypoxanthine phosphoribosyltransferase [Oscillospiraceae bacterium]